MRKRCPKGKVLVKTKKGSYCKTPKSKNTLGKDFCSLNLDKQKSVIEKFPSNSCKTVVGALNKLRPRTFSKKEEGCSSNRINALEKYARKLYCA